MSPQFPFWCRSLLLLFPLLATPSFLTTKSAHHVANAASFSPVKNHQQHPAMSRHQQQQIQPFLTQEHHGIRPTDPSRMIRGGGGGTNTILKMMTTPGDLFDNTPLWRNHQITWGLNALGLVISLTTGSHLHLDLLGTGAFAAGAWLAQPAVSNFRTTSSTTAVILWAGKLASFLFYRALKVQHDGRLTETLGKASWTVGFWLFSAAWGILTALPHTLGTTNPQHPGTPLTNGIGLSMFAVGWIVETVADYQKWTFKQNHPSGSFCNVGLWSISQHPNWFGNLLLWTGIFVLNAPALVEATPAQASLVEQVWSWRRFAIACLSPMFMWYLFSGQASGSITDALSMANKKYGYGTDPAYTSYVDDTPLIFPRLWPGKS